LILDGPRRTQSGPWIDATGNRQNSEQAEQPRAAVYHGSSFRVARRGSRGGQIIGSASGPPRPNCPNTSIDPHPGVTLRLHNPFLHFSLHAVGLYKSRGHRVVDVTSEISAPWSAKRTEATERTDTTPGGCPRHRLTDFRWYFLSSQSFPSRAYVSSGDGSRRHFRPLRQIDVQHQRRALWLQQTLTTRRYQRGLPLQQGLPAYVPLHAESAIEHCE